MNKFLYALPAFILLFSCNNNKETVSDKPRQVKQYSIEQFYKSSNVFGGSFSFDDTRLLVSSNESGIYNVVEIDIATGQKKPLTNSAKESVFANDYVPGSRNILSALIRVAMKMTTCICKRLMVRSKTLQPGRKKRPSFLAGAGTIHICITPPIKGIRIISIYIKWIQQPGHPY